MEELRKLPRTLTFRVRRSCGHWESAAAFTKLARQVAIQAERKAQCAACYNGESAWHADPDGAYRFFREDDWRGE